MRALSILGPLLLCPIVLSCVTSPQITGRLWHKLQLRNLFPSETEWKTTLSLPHKFQLSWSLPGGKTLRLLPRLSMHAHISPPLLPHGPFCRCLSLTTSHDWFVIISSFLTPHRTLHRCKKLWHVCKYQKKKEWGIHIHIYINNVYMYMFAYRNKMEIYMHYHELDNHQTYCWTVTRSATHPFLIISSWNSHWSRMKTQLYPESHFQR